MRRSVLNLLACPNCRGTIQLFESSEENAIRILRGTLICTSCARQYPIEKGVPRLAEATEDVVEISRRFSFQWLSRWRGQFETTGRCYGLDDAGFVGWINEQLQSRRKAKIGEWMLDAGCGSGQKTEILARLCSEQNVLGLDLAVEPLEEAVASFSTRPNLDYVQGNILEPPFKAAQFDYGVSIGALHHTPDTRKAFTVFRRLLKDDTTCLIWIYPTYKEGPEWQPPYFARDFLLLNQGHRIPPRFLRWIAYMLVLANYPIVDFHFRQHFRRIKKDLPFFNIDRMTRRERFSAEVFFAFDTCLPRYQFRHTIKEVESWFIEEGLVPIAHAHSFYWASTPSRN